MKRFFLFFLYEYAESFKKEGIGICFIDYRISNPATASITKPSLPETPKEEHVRNKHWQRIQHSCINRHTRITATDEPTNSKYKHPWRKISKIDYIGFLVNGRNSTNHRYQIRCKLIRHFTLISGFLLILYLSEVFHNVVVDSATF